MQSRKLAATCAAVVALGASAGCAGKPDGSALYEMSVRQDLAKTADAATPTDGGASLAAPTGWQLWITILEARIHIGDDEPMTAEAPPGGVPEGPDTTGPERGDDGAIATSEDDDPEWHVVFKGTRRFDLLDPRSTETLLGAEVLPAGRLTQARLVTAGTAELVSPTATITLKCPSCTESGLKVRLADQPTVAAGQQVHITLLFDAQNSISAMRDHAMLTPVVRARMAM
jgi:hypothetical protein